MCTIVRMLLGYFILEVGDRVNVDRNILYLLQCMVSITVQSVVKEKKRLVDIKIEKLEFCNRINSYATKAYTDNYLANK